MCDRKQQRGGHKRPSDKPVKKTFRGNRFTSDKNTDETSTSAKKLKNNEGDLTVSVDQCLRYCIVSFSIFAALQEILLCKYCKKEIKFNKYAEKGLGFDLEVICSCSERSRIPSSPKFVGKGGGYEINRRFVYVMRLLGVGFSGISTFLGLMDIGETLSKTGYYDIIEHIHIAVKAVSKVVFKTAVKLESEKNLEKNLPEKKLAVSGDGSWPKRGFSSLLGIVSLIGKYSNKIIDVIVKSSICKACEKWADQKDTPEFDAWFSEHQENDECNANHSGSAGKMEVEGVKEMFTRSVEQYGVMYEFYIGDGDTKTFKELSDLKPYGDELQVKKKECVLHVKKRMYRRAKEAKKQLTQVKKAKKALEKEAAEKEKKKKNPR